MITKNNNLEKIKERLDIVDVVATYVKLDKSGSQFKARCPFHQEKSPSFYVSPSKGYFHCFGCAAHGDIFTFVSRIEGIEFRDALKLLADRAGVKLENISKDEDSKSFDILEEATKFFQMNLANNFEASQYVAGRGILPETINKFRIGYAQNDWRTLYMYLNNLKFTEEEIVASGLCIKHEKGLYDRFRSRIMFPVQNSSGKVVAFTGRIIGPDTAKDGAIVAKYVNSPETNVYHKSSILFAYDKAKKEIAKVKKVILVEGQMDAVMAHQAGTENVVAISGTALTQEHVNILKRFAETITLSLDTDNAGYEAMKKSAMISFFNDLNVEALNIQDAKDPADIITDSLQEWQEIVSKPVSIFTIFINKILEIENDKIKQVARIRKEIFPILSLVKSDMLKGIYIEEIANKLGIDKNAIFTDLKLVSINVDLQQIDNRNQKLEQGTKDKNKVEFNIEYYINILESIFNINENKSEIINSINKKFINIIKYLKEKFKIEFAENIGMREVKEIEINKYIEQEIEQFKKQGRAVEQKDVLEEYVNINYKRFIEKLMKSSQDIDIIDFIIKNR